MKGADIRSAFLGYFRERGHTVVPSSPLVPQNDPTLLFVNSGMVQFKDCFLGADKRAYTRATSCQKSLRLSGKHNDLENVGITPRHHTLFEMLGNFSFGDYFKKEAIAYAWEFVTQVLKIDKRRLWVTVYEKDDEAERLWKETTDVLNGRILRLGEKDNFWAMGETGPCGPCSEIHYYRGADLNSQSEERFRAEDSDYLEIWNLVFMQYNRDAAGKLGPLPKPSVDTGMGLERTAMILQGANSNYDTDLLRPVITLCEELSGFKYDGTSFVERDLKTDKAYARDVAMRVLADHSRAVAFLIADGINPGSDGRAYVLRRLIRRAVRHSRALNFKEPILAKACAIVIKSMSQAYPELLERQGHILNVVDAEERKFEETLDAGLAVLEKEISKLKPGQQISGKAAFLLHDTYGFPLDLTEDALKAHGLTVNVPEFSTEMTAQRERSREDRRGQGIEFSAITIESPNTTFVGYEAIEAKGAITQVLGTADKKSFGPGDEVGVVFDTTPFYAESGGQVGDTGLITLSGAKLKVIDTQKVQDKYFVHSCCILEGELGANAKGGKAELRVDAFRRDRIRAHHSATHLIHSALRKFLGDHIKQAGSKVDDHATRFDFSHFQPLSLDQLRLIENFVNEHIRCNHEVTTRVLPIAEAKKTGAVALFGEKYGDAVRVVEIGPESMEFCGGTHVKRSGDIGFLMVSSEGGVSAGVRRIECVAGLSALEALEALRAERERISLALKTDSHQLDQKVERLVARLRDLEREVESVKGKVAAQATGDLMGQARLSPSGIKVIAESVDVTDTDTLKSMVDSLRNRLGSGVVALASKGNGQAMIVAGVTADLTASVNAGQLIKEATKVSGGRGGGKADFAQAGGVDPAKLKSALDTIFTLIN